MKKLNKIFALTLALALIFSLTVSASAEGYRTLDEIKASGKLVIGLVSDKKPFGYIDEYGEYQGYDVYLARGGMTMAIVTHEMRFAEAVADRVLFLEEGVVLEEGTPEKFFHAPTTERARHFLQSFTYASKRDKTEVQSKNNSED